MCPHDRIGRVEEVIGYNLDNWWRLRPWQLFYWLYPILEGQLPAFGILLLKGT